MMGAFYQIWTGKSDETEGFDEISLEDWQAKCSQLVNGVWQYTKRIELRLSSIEYRLDRLEKRDGH